MEGRPRMKCPTCGQDAAQSKLSSPPSCVFEDIFRLRCPVVGPTTPLECRVADGTETSDIAVVKRLPHTTEGFNVDCSCLWEKIGTRMRVIR